MCPLKSCQLSVLSPAHRAQQPPKCVFIAFAYGRASLVRLCCLHKFALESYTRLVKLTCFECVPERAIRHSSRYTMLICPCPPNKVIKYNFWRAQLNDGPPCSFNVTSVLCSARVFTPTHTLITTRAFSSSWAQARKLASLSVSAKGCDMSVWSHFLNDNHLCFSSRLFDCQVYHSSRVFISFCYNYLSESCRSLVLASFFRSMFSYPSFSSRGRTILS